MSKTLPVQKNEYIDVLFEDLTHDGAGVAKVKRATRFLFQMDCQEKRQRLK